MLVACLVAWLSGVPVAFGINEVSTTVLTNDEATEYIADKTLRTALFQLAFYQFAEKHTLPKHEGRVFSITRYEPINLPQNPLTQGTPPSNTPMTINRVQATAEQWGATICIYDVPELSIAHPVLQKAVDKLGEQAAKTIERETQRVLLAGTNVQFANARATRALLIATDYINSLEIRRTVSNLRKSGAAPWRRTSTNTTRGYIEKITSDGGGTTAAKPGLDASYKGLIGIVDTDVAQDLNSDSTFVNAAAYSQVRALNVNELGMWLGVVWVESNFMPSITLLASPACAGATMTGLVGGFTPTAAYDLRVTRQSKAYGLEEAVTALIDVTQGGADDGISVVLPAGATYTYRIYVGADAGTLYEVQTAGSLTTVAADDISGPSFEGGQTVYVTTLPTTGRTAPVAPATGVTVHTSFVFGIEAFGCVELDALKAYLTEDKAEKSDPLNQRRYAGWKAMFKAVIANQTFLRRIESASAFAG
jgi:N4-gp56 family major capsid protein